MTVRADGRGPDELRQLNIQRNYIAHAEGSVFIEQGQTKLIVTATVEDRVPPFLRGSGTGWVTAEYAMLPRATQVRTPRDVSKGRVAGRTSEIQRLVGRALRSVVDLTALGERTIWIDCDVIQADGGTRTTAISGAFVALLDALYGMALAHGWSALPVTSFLGAVSVGLLDGKELLDLCFEEDSKAQVDMNVVMTGHGELVEVQATAEGLPFGRGQMDRLLDLAQKGISEVISYQKSLFPEELVRKMGGSRRAGRGARVEE